MNNKFLTKCLLTALLLSLSSVVSCGGVGSLSMADLLGASMAGGAESQGLNATGDASLSDESSDDPDADQAQADLADGTGVGETQTTYYIDENGETVEVAVNDGASDAANYADVYSGDAGTDALTNESPADETDFGDSGEVSVDDTDLGSTGSDPVDGGNAAESDSSGDRSLRDTEFSPSDVASLPVTLPKDDPDADCSAEDRETVSMAYDEGSERHMMRHAGRSGVSKNGLYALAQEVIRQTGGGKMDREFVFFPDRLVLDSGDTDVTPVQCKTKPDIDVSLVPGRNTPGETGSAYAWQTMGESDLQDYEMETGTLRIRGRGLMELGTRATVMEFVGQASMFRLHADDFGLASNNAKTVIPYIIMRPRGM